MTDCKFPENIEHVGDLCTGCGSCQAVCPQEAVFLHMDTSAGFYKPVIKWNICTKCGLCSKICPGVEVDFYSLEQSIFGKVRNDYLLGVFEKCYVGHTFDQELRFRASSGGLVTELLKTALEQRLVGGVTIATIVIGSEGELQPTPIIARTPGELMTGIGSKYMPVAMNTCIDEILRADDHFAVVGLPCHIHAIRKMQEAIPILKKRIIFCVGLFCAKNIRLTGTYYLLNKLRMDKIKISSLSYRGQGWPGGMTISFKDGSSLFLANEDYYKSDFDAFTIPRCSLCCDQTNELADIACGDAWHIVKNDTLGSSLVIVRNKIGLDLVTHALKAGRIKLAETERNAVVKAQGDFVYKKRNIIGRFTLSKILGKRIPKYIGVEYPKTGILTYLHALSVFFKMKLSSRKSFWSVLKLYCKITDKIAGV